MGNKFLALRKSEVAKVAPDRAALMGKIDMKEIREADERWLRLLFGEPYEARFQSGGVHVYDGNGDEVLTYTAGVGWHEKESKAETQVHGALKAAYYDAYHAASGGIEDGNPHHRKVRFQFCYLHPCHIRTQRFPGLNQS